MLRRTIFRRTALATNDVHRVTAWFAYSTLNLEHLEAQLRDARVPGVRKLTPTPAPRRGVTVPMKDDLLLFSVDDSSSTAAASMATPLPILDSLAAPSPDASVGMRKTFCLFRDGTIVGWNASTRDFGILVAEAADAPKSSERMAPVSETLKFSLGGSSTGIQLGSDTILLEDHDDSLKLPFCYVMAQSLKIDVVDGELRPVLKNVKSWQTELGRSGHMKCGVKELRKTKAKLLGVYESIDFGSNVQTTPKLFWMPEYQQLRTLYKDARQHLEIDGRLELVEDRAETVNEALDYLSSEVHSESIEFLTWVIIWLIAVEIVLALGVHHMFFAAVYRVTQKAGVLEVDAA